MTDLTSKAIGAKCPECQHTHTGRQWAYVCAGCPCTWRPPAVAEADGQRGLFPKSATVVRRPRPRPRP